MTRFIEIVEVGARDGLQNEAAVLEAADRIEFIRALEACGARRIEAVRFVNPRRGAPRAGGGGGMGRRRPAAPPRAARAPLRARGRAGAGRPLRGGRGGGGDGGVGVGGAGGPPLPPGSTGYRRPFGVVEPPSPRWCPGGYRQEAGIFKV